MRVLTERLTERLTDRMTERLTTWAAVVCGAAALLLSATVVVLAGGPARSLAPAEPFGGCAEAWQAPRSPGAEACRDRGYTVSARWLVGPRGVVLHSTLPHCRHEDGSGGRRPCTWNVGRRTDGNGGGLAYKVRRDMSVRYVWATRPTVAGWRWVSLREARRLAREVTGPRERRSVRGWQRCVIRHGTLTWVKCADGQVHRL